MNKATEEYVRVLAKSHEAAARDCERYDDRTAYCPCYAGALQAHLGMTIERLYGEGIDWDAARDAKANRRGKAA